MLPEFREIENGIMAVIGEKYGLGPFPKDDIHQADLVMLATEKRDVIAPGGPEWELKLPAPLPAKTEPYSWYEAEGRFLLASQAMGIE
jgi:hypothetical protein